MVRRATIALLSVLACLAGASASAQELVFHLANDTEYNSNYRGVEKGEDPSFRNRIGPRMTLQDQYGRFTYSLEYIGQYSWYIEPWDSKLNSWEQTAAVAASYAITRRTQLSITEAFRDLSSVRFGAEDQAADTLDAGQRKYQRNAFAYELEHSFSQRLVGLVTGAHDWLDYEQNIDRSDSSSLSAGGQLLYALTRADRVGGGVSYAYQTFDEELGEPESIGQIYNAYLSWDHRFQDDFRLRLSGGPTYIENKTSSDIRTVNYRAQFNPPGSTNLEFLEVAGGCTTEQACLALGNFSAGPLENTFSTTSLRIENGSDTQDDITFFARASLTKSWIDWDFTGNYVRRQSNAAGDSGTSTLDRVSLRLTYDPNTTWDIYGLFGWQRRERATRQAQLADFIVQADANGFALRQQGITVKGSKRSRTDDQFSFVLGSSRRFSRQFFGRLEFRYRHQLQQRSNRADRKTDFFVLNLRLDYSLAPIRF
jgi:hypothetical protein